MSVCTGRGRSQTVTDGFVMTREERRLRDLQMDAIFPRLMRWANAARAILHEAKYAHVNIYPEGEALDDESFAATKGRYNSA